ncbi:hypothetical protein [Cohnella sp. AR92]|uniref:hypothetical protein n=1 Tax=Cohnella sp. AR92 TaxID=648716 RepID=UPI000F8D8F78|nr:hypothetical protein [Cohnella sp. AR92]RUS46854.1 hypothetical protein ELR57_10615 [Cohnella sp. AR92]
MVRLSPEYAVRVASQLLPIGAELAYLEYPARHPAVLAADLDGDRNPEITCVYRTAEGMQALIAKHSIEGWYTACRMKGPGYGVARMAAAPIAGIYPPTLAVGWQIGERWAQLDLWQYEQGGYRHLTPSDILYSKLAIVESSPGRNRDGLCRLALWVQDTEEAYRVDLYRWQAGGLVRDPEAYPAYFANAVVPYYTKLVSERPGSTLYRRFLEEARGQAGGTAPRRETAVDLTVLAPERARDVALEAAIAAAYGMTAEDQGSYAYNRLDLNGDGSPETIVFLSGSTFCGSGGCSAAIFRTEDGNYRLLSKLTLVHTPIIVGNTMTNGYRDLIVIISGGGIQEPVYKILKFNGINYPSNPTIEPELPAGARLEGKAILGDDSSLFSGIPLKP